MVKNMKRKFIYIITLSLITIIACFALCGCGNISGEEVSLGNITFTIPDGKWKEGKETTENALYYEGNDGGYICVAKTNTPEYDDDSRVGDVFYDKYLYGASDLTFIDGYLAQCNPGDRGSSESSLSIKVSDNEYYFVYLFSWLEGDAYLKLEEQFYNSVSFSEKGNYMIDEEEVVNWTDAKSVIGNPKKQIIKGEVAEVTHSDAGGGATFVDLGVAYPDPNRVTGVIWENDNDVWIEDTSFLDKLKGRTIYMNGFVKNYNGSANIKIYDSSQFVWIKDKNEISMFN